MLIHDDNKKIIKTLKSRCLPFKVSLSFDQSIKISNLLLNENIFDLINYDFIDYYAKPGDYINLINFSKKNQINLNEFSLKQFLLLLINENYYKKNNFIKFKIFYYLELYFLKILNQSINKNKISSFYTKFIHKINYSNKFNLDYESLFMEFKSKVLHE
jgi:DNA polymerase-3 subunit delta'